MGTPHRLRHVISFYTPLAHRISSTTTDLAGNVAAIPLFDILTPSNSWGLTASGLSNVFMLFCAAALSTRPVADEDGDPRRSELHLGGGVMVQIAEADVNLPVRIARRRGAHLPHRR